MRAATALLLAGLAALPPAGAAAQQRGARRVAGVVVGGPEGAPVAGATVALRSTALRTTTDSAGRFTFLRAPTGPLGLVSVALGFAPASVAVPAGAADTAVRVVMVPNPVEVAPIVVTASRDVRLASEAPVSVSVATTGDLRREATIGVDEAVARVPGVEILDGQISIRGSSGFAKGVGSEVLLLVDGVPATQGDRGGIDWDLLPVTEIERIEVVKGTGSALYGSSALGGVVNVITRPIPDRPDYRARILMGGYADPPYAVWRWRTTPALFGGADLSASRRVGAVKLLVSGGALGDGGYRQNNDDERSHGLVKLVLAGDPRLEAELLAAAAHENHAQVLFWCVQGQCVDHGLPYQPFRVDSTTLGDRTVSDEELVQATARRVVNPDIAVRGRLSWYRTRFHDEFRSGNDASVSDRLGGELGAEWHAGAGRVLSAGTEVAYSTATSDLFGDHSQTEMAWYAEDATPLGAAARLTLGARVDATAVDAVAWDAVASPRLAATWRLAPVQLRASVGRGFRAPSLAERFTSTTEQGLQVIPNPSLEDESSWSGEVGATTAPLAGVVVDGALFWSEYRNLIQPALVTGGTQIQFTNVTRARVRGLDVSAQAAGLAGGRLRAAVAYTFLDARDLTLGLPLAFRSRNLATVGADWRLATWAGGPLQVGAEFRYASAPARVEIFESDRRVPQRTVDLRLMWRRPGLGVVARVANVFDYLYTLVPRTLEPPRTFSLAVTLERR